jgi:hypothetical protein
MPIMEASMHKPFAHTLTSADRQFISRWLIGISATFGTLTLLIVGIVVASHYRDIDRQNGPAAMQASGR